MPFNSTEDKIRDLSYDYSQRTEYAACSPEENWLRAESKIKNPKPHFGQVIERGLRTIKPASKLLTRVLPLISVCSIVATMVGSLFLVAYLRSVGAILPSIDASMSILVLLVAFAFCAIFSLTMLLFLYPFLKNYSDPFVRKAYPVLNCFDAFWPHIWECYRTNSFEALRSSEGNGY